MRRGSVCLHLRNPDEALRQRTLFWITIECCIQMYKLFPYDDSNRIFPMGCFRCIESASYATIGSGIGVDDEHCRWPHAPADFRTFF